MKILGCKLCSHRSSGETDEQVMYNHEQHILREHIIELSVPQRDLMEQDLRTFNEPNKTTKSK